VMNAAQRAVMVKRACSVRSTLALAAAPSGAASALLAACATHARARLTYWRPVRAAAQYDRLCAARHWL
jgi:hypothetical protein